MKFFAPKPDKEKVFREVVNSICEHRRYETRIERFGPYDLNSDSVYICKDCGKEFARSKNKKGT